MTNSDHSESEALVFGAVAFLDALGFKGIWSRHPHRTVIEKLRAVTFGAGVHADSVLNVPELRLASRVISLSDTIVVSAAVTTGEDRSDARGNLVCKVAAIASVCSKVAMIYATMADAPTLVFRGAVSVGQFFHDDRFLIGPAIDEAAEYEKLPNGGMVWLCPSAHDVTREARFSAASGRLASFADLELFLVPDYPVPIKGDEPRHAPVVSPFLFVQYAHEEAFLSRVDESFVGENPDIPIKRENTMRFLRHARGLNPRGLMHVQSRP